MPTNTAPIVTHRDVNRCSACGGNHKGLAFVHLKHARNLDGILGGKDCVFTERALCPVKKVSIYAKAIPKRKTRVTLNLVVIPLYATGADIQEAFRLWGVDARTNPDWNKAWLKRVKSMNNEEVAREDTATFLAYLTKALTLKPASK